MAYLQQARSGPSKCYLLMNNTGVRPIGDRLLVRRVEAERMSHGLHLPDGAEQWPNVGTILEIGSKVKDTELRVGQRVLFRPRPASALIRDDREPGERDKHTWERVIVLREDDLIGLILE